ncbi:MAG: acyltransferase [Roseburia sp.]|nr:acyltransferase [Roseburia sp.]
MMNNAITGNKKIDEIDILKGLGIICVVMDHARISNRFFYTFEVGLFFIIAGYCFNNSMYNSTKSLASYIKKQTMRLYIPLITINIIFALLNNWFMKIGIYSDNPILVDETNKLVSFGLDSYYSAKDLIKQIVKIICMFDTTKMGGTTWFIRALLVITIAYAIMYRLLSGQLRNSMKQVVCVVVIVLLLGITVEEMLCGILPTIVIDMTIYFSLYCCGNLYRMMGGKPTDNYIRIIGGVILWMSYVIGQNYLVDDYVMKKLLYFVASIATWEIGVRLVALLPKNSIKRVLIYIGKNTMPIIFLNFIAFKVVIWLQIKIYYLPQYYLAAFPSYAHDWWWTICLCIVGILIPLGANIVYKKMKVIVINIRNTINE